MIRPMSAFPDFREALTQLLAEAREAGIEDDQIAGELRGYAQSCEERYQAKYAQSNYPRRPICKSKLKSQ